MPEKPVARTETAAASIRFQRPTFPSGEAIERYLAVSRRERWFSNFGPCAELLGERRQLVVVAHPGEQVVGEVAPQPGQ